ncbi:MAG: CU044_2847 family protein [Egibacteraceae bacterium]
MATYVVEVPLGAADQSVWIEVSPSDLGEGIELVSDDAGRAVARLSRTLEASLEPVQAFVSTTVDKLRRAKHAPDELQVQFALKLGGETGFIVAKGTGEAVLTVTASWSKPSEE